MKLEKDKCRKVVSIMTFRLSKDEKWIGLKLMWLPYILELLWVVGLTMERFWKV